MSSRRIDRYVDINRSTSILNGIGAGAIWLAMIAGVWGDVRAVAILGIGMVSTVAFNMWVNHWLLDRIGMRAEVVRSVVNAASNVIAASLTGWPLATWLFPPYVALAFDYSGGRHARFVVASMLVATCAAGLANGQSWHYAAAATVLSLYGWQISEARVRVIRDMLARSEEQRIELERAELELRAAQKLEALGRLASGIAHEINTPIQFVGDSLKFVQEGLRDMIDTCELDTTTQAANDIDLSYLIENMPQALDRASEGIGRVAAIVQSMKQFARPEEHARMPMDLNEAIEATLVISRHEYKLVADVVTQLGVLPLVSANAGEINQVLLNVIVNAAHAIADTRAQRGDVRGTITVSTRVDGDDVVIAVADTGTGIPSEIRERVFEPFFTTKEVGRGTGQGLAISRAIVERHGGRLGFETASGRGTTFTIRLPVETADLAHAA